LGWNCLGCGIGNHGTTQKNETQERMRVQNEEMVSAQKAISGNNYYVIGKSRRQRPITIPAVYAVEVDYQLRIRSLGTKETGGMYHKQKWMNFAL